MTSRTTKRKRPDSAPVAGALTGSHARRLAPGGRRVSAQTAFTLLELLLALALLTLMMGLALGAVWNSLRSVKIAEHGTRMCALLRATRAEAANTGRRFRISFDAETRQPLVSVEPNPLTEPGTFAPCEAWWVRQAAFDENVQILRCERTGASDFAERNASTPSLEGENAELAELTFYPDGSSDSVRLVLTNDDEDRPWRLLITLNGVDGTIQKREITEDELENLDEPPELIEPIEPDEPAGPAELTEPVGR